MSDNQEQSFKIQPHPATVSLRASIQRVYGVTRLTRAFSTLRHFGHPSRLILPLCVNTFSSQLPVDTCVTVSSPTTRPKGSRVTTLKLHQDWDQLPTSLTCTSKQVTQLKLEDLTFHQMILPSHWSNLNRGRNCSQPRQS